MRRLAIALVLSGCGGAVDASGSDTGESAGGTDSAVVVVASGATSGGAATVAAAHAGTATETTAAQPTQRCVTATSSSGACSVEQEDCGWWIGFVVFDAAGKPIKTFSCSDGGLGENCEATRVKIDAFSAVNCSGQDV